MGGEGAISGMITSLKNNNRRRKHHTPFSNDRSGGYDKGKPIYDFPEATPEVIETIKLRMLKEQKNQRIITFLIFVCIIILILLIII